MKLSAKRKIFVQEYLVDLNATQAAIRAGYAETRAKETGYRLVTDGHVSEEIQKALSEREKRVEITADYVLTTIRDTVERCRQAERIVDREGNPTGDYKFESASVLKGCELLGRHLAMWTDKQKVEHTGEITTITRRIIDAAE